MTLIDALTSCSPVATGTELAISAIAMRAPNIGCGGRMDCSLIDNTLPTFTPVAIAYSSARPRASSIALRLASSVMALGFAMLNVMPLI